MHPDRVVGAKALGLVQTYRGAVDGDYGCATFLDNGNGGVEAEPAGSVYQDGLAVFESGLVEAEGHLGQAQLALAAAASGILCDTLWKG